MFLKELCKLKIGTITNRYRDRNGKPYKILKMNQISCSENYFNHHDAESVLLEPSKIKPLSTDDVAIFLHGQMLAITIEDCANVVAPSSFAVLTDLDTNIVDKWFLIYLINKFTSSKVFFDQHSTLGTSMRVMQINALRNFKIMLPEIEIQRTIGAYYKRICFKRRYHRELIEHECDLEDNDLAQIVSEILKEEI